MASKELEHSKLEVIQLLLQTNEKALIEKVKTLLLGKTKKAEVFDETIVGHRPNGDVITQAQLKLDVEASKKSYYEKGGLTIEELEKNSEEWLK